MGDAQESEHQLWVNLSALGDGNIFAILPQLMEKMLDVEGEGVGRDDEPYDLVLPSDDEWQTKIYYKLVEKQRIADAALEENQLFPHTENLIEIKLKEYSSKTIFLLNIRHTVGIINSRDKSCTLSFNEFAKNLPSPKILNKLANPQIGEYFIFVSDPKDIRTVTEKWTTQKPTHFIICQLVKNFQKISKLLEEMWTRKFLNFVFVYVDDALRIVTFNPFEDKIVDLQQDLFPNKLSNLAGYEIKVAMFENPPNLLKGKKGKWRGKDYGYLQLIIYAMNASLRIVETLSSNEYEGIQEALINNEAEFSLVGLFQATGFNNVSIFYSQIYDAIVVMLPNIHSNVDILKVFDKGVWIFILGVTLILWYFYENLNKKYRRSIKCVLLLLVTIPSIFSNVFQSGISSILTANKSKENLDTIEALKSSNLPLIVFPRLYDFVEPIHNFSSQIHIYPKLEVYEMIRNGEQGKGFILPSTVALHFLRNRTDYRIMKESLVPGERTYLFQDESPFLDEVNLIFIRLRDTGYIGKISAQRIGVFFEQQKIYLKIEHIMSAFYLLYGGYGVGFLVLIFENFRSRRKRITFKNKE